MADAHAGRMNVGAGLIQLPGHRCKWDPQFIFGVSIVSCCARRAGLRIAGQRASAAARPGSSQAERGALPPSVSQQRGYTVVAYPGHGSIGHASTACGHDTPYRAHSALRCGSQKLFCAHFRTSTGTFNRAPMVYYKMVSTVRQTARRDFLSLAGSSLDAAGGAIRRDGGRARCCLVDFGKAWQRAAASVMASLSP